MEGIPLESWKYQNQVLFNWQTVNTNFMFNTNFSFNKNTLVNIGDAKVKRYALQKFWWGQNLAIIKLLRVNPLWIYLCNSLEEWKKISGFQVFMVWILHLFIAKAVMWLQNFNILLLTCKVSGTGFKANNLYMFHWTIKTFWLIFCINFWSN